jgi:hypothetical protein
MRRVRYALAALVFAFALGLAVPVAADDCHPLCAVYDDPWHPLYWFYNCRSCPPPSPEG